MVLNIFNNIWHKINDLGENIKDFFLNNGRNPILWLIIVVIALIIFEFVFKKLNND